MYLFCRGGAFGDSFRVQVQFGEMRRAEQTGQLSWSGDEDQGILNCPIYEI